jgi:hypothetical protein
MMTIMQANLASVTDRSKGSIDKSIALRWTIYKLQD